MIVIPNLQELHQVDDVAWLEKTVELLKNRQWECLDLENLIEELEDLGNEKRHAVESLLEQIIRHCLLIEFWDVERDNNLYHWRAEIIGFRTQLKRRITTNLYNHLIRNQEAIYQDALKYVQVKTAFQIEFPASCPYTMKQLLDIDWIPLVDR